jgi:hypothetical protein
MSRFPYNCPHCDFFLDAGDVYEVALTWKDMTPEKALMSAGHYGWTPDNKVRFSRIVGIYSRHTDRTEEWQCPECQQEIEVKPFSGSGYFRTSELLLVE